MKTFWKYTLITILMLCGLFMLGVLFLFFVPGSSLFGITYVSLNNEYYSKAYAITDLDKVVFNSRAYKVNLVPASTENISVKVYSNAVGFTRTKYSNVNLTANSKNGVLSLEVEEPHGLVLNNKSFVELRLPKNMTADLVMSNRRADVTIENESLNISNFKYTTQSGALKLNAGTIGGNIDLEMNNGDALINEKFGLNNNNVSLSIKNGLFDASASKLGDVTITNNTRGVIKIKECNKLTERVEVAGGRLELNQIGSIDVQTSDSDVYINKLIHGGTIYLNNTNSSNGKVDINETNAETDIRTKEGSIWVKKATTGLFVESSSGDIKVENVSTSVNAKTTYGNIEVYFDENAPKNSGTNHARELTAETSNGKITSTGAENVRVTVTNKGRVELILNDVVGDNYVRGKDGNVSVKVNKDAVYDLTTGSDQGDVSVNLLQLGEFGGYTTNVERTTHVNHIETDTVNNFLKVTTLSGDLYIRDTGL